MNENPIFLLGSHKSGTTLLRSIFDGHPDLFVVPFETHYFQNMYYWVDYNYRRQTPAKAGREELVGRLVRFIEHINRSLDPIGDIPITFNIDTDTFRDTISRMSIEMDDRDRFSLYMDAIYRSLNQTALPEDLRVVEKTVENAEFAVHLQRMFPKARFVHIVRNPYATIVSLRKYKAIRSTFPLISRLLETLYNSYYHLYHNPKIIDNYYILRYEDLLTDSRRETEKLSRFLELPFDECLLTPTKAGNRWKGNSSSEEQLRGFDSSRINAWKQEISPMEVKYVNTLFGHVLENFDYEQEADPSMPGFMKPVKNEGLLRYIANRLYLGYISYRPGTQI